MRPENDQIVARFLLAKDEVLQAGTTSKELARAMGMYAQNIAGIESGERRLSALHIALFCFHYDYNANWILLGEGDKMQKPNSGLTLSQRISILEIKMREKKG